MILLLQYMIIFASVLSLVALGGCFSEHSGVINLGLEGIMVVGAMGGAMIMNLVPATLPAPVMILIVCVASIIFGMLYSCLLGLACINLNADQTLIGTAMNMLSTAVAVIVVRSYNTSRNSSDVSSILKYVDAKKKFLIRFGSFEFNWFMIIALAAVIISYIVLYKTKFGLRLRACGENPQAADSVGINVYRMRWAGGFGFLALAVMIFGQWKPHRIGLAALLFGFFRSLSNVYSGIPFLKAMNIPSAVYNMMPYIISLIVLAFTSSNSAAPKAEGIPYDKGTR